MRLNVQRILLNHGFGAWGCGIVWPSGKAIVFVLLVGLFWGARDAYMELGVGLGGA
jgi:hypothetical protein